MGPYEFRGPFLYSASGHNLGRVTRWYKTTDGERVRVQRGGIVVDIPLDRAAVQVAV